MVGIPFKQFCQAKHVQMHLCYLVFKGSLTHLFHELLIVVVAIDLPGAVESHGGDERASASKECPSQSVGSPFIKHACSYLDLGQTADVAVSTHLSGGIKKKTQRCNRRILTAAGDKVFSER